MLEYDAQKIELIKEFMKKRPKTLGLYRYGSGYYKEEGNADSQADLIAIVGRNRKWNLENMRLNPKDYSFTSKVYMTITPEFLQNFIAPFSFLTGLGEDEKKVKLGVITKKQAIRDLKGWKSFLLAGRAQKVNFSPIQADKDIEEANNEENRKNALIAALLLLDKSKYNLRDLFIKLYGLSFKGDLRTLFAEDPNKVSSTVDKNYERTVETYEKYGLFKIIDGTDKIEVDKVLLIKEAKNIPLRLPKILLDEKHIEKLKKVINGRFVLKNLGHTFVQYAKGVATAGPAKAIPYVKRKINKHFSSQLAEKNIEAAADMSKQSKGLQYVKGIKKGNSHTK